MANTQAEYDFEYHVKFPTPTPIDDPNAENESDINKQQTPITETAVMIIGWMDCKDKILAKYSKFYEDRGCTTIRFSPSIVDLSSQRARAVAKKLLDVLIEMDLAENPVLFHIFSNGGCIIYQEMRKELAENPQFEEISKLGVIYDSAPGRFRISTDINIYFSSYSKSIVTTMLKGLAWVVYPVFKGANYLLHLLGLSLLPDSLYENMMFAQDGCPELYLYSKADEIIPARDVEEIIQRRRMQGVDITTSCWDDSPHVEHFRLHRESYINQCYNFLQKCSKIVKGSD